MGPVIRLEWQGLIRPGPAGIINAVGRGKGGQKVTLECQVLAFCTILCRTNGAVHVHVLAHVMSPALIVLLRDIVALIIQIVLTIGKM